MSPHAMRRPCSHPSCPVLVRSGRCPAHSAERERQRGGPDARGYDATWRGLRAWFMQRAQPLGQCGARLPGAPATTSSRCQVEGRISLGVRVNHIRPHRQGDGISDPHLRLDPNNLELLCPSCDSRVTATWDGGFGRPRRSRCEGPK
jgi:5-methylcytosine-specific restriction endonuclease McrA